MKYKIDLSIKVDEYFQKWLTETENQEFLRNFVQTRLGKNGTKSPPEIDPTCKLTKVDRFPITTGQIFSFVFKQSLLVDMISKKNNCPLFGRL